MNIIHTTACITLLTLTAPLHAEELVIEIEAIDVAYREMVEVAARLAESGGRGEVARRVLAGTGAEAKVGDDGVPTWLRKRFQAEVHRQYSDHLPVYCMLS